MSWNPVLNFVADLKERFKEVYNDYVITMEVEYDENYIYNIPDSNKYKNIIEYWVDIVDMQEYRDLIAYIDISQYENFVLLRYKHNIAIPDDFWYLYDEFYRECRTVVIDYVKLELVSCGFKKFFNINELPEYDERIIGEKIENSNIFEITDKLDGSMQIISCYEGSIIMCGSQAIDPDKSWRLQDGMKMLNSKENLNLKGLVLANPDLSFVVEYIAVKDRHCVVYTKEQEGLYLVGIRSKKDGYEYPYKTIINMAKEYNILTTSLCNITPEEMYNTMKNALSTEKEGWVLNIDGSKVKIKCDDYVKIHKLLGKLSSHNVIIKAIADDTIDDLKSKINSLGVSYQAKIHGIMDNVYSYCNVIEESIQQYYSELPEGLNRKEAMLWIQQNVPKKHIANVMNKYLGKSYNILRSHAGKYIKYNDIIKELKERRMTWYE